MRIGPFGTQVYKSQKKGLSRSTARRFAASHSRHRSRSTGARRAAAGLLLACAALVATSAPVDAQTATTFVSNIGQPDHSLATIVVGTPRAQQFTTGSNISGYTLTEITVNIGFASSSAVPIFSIYTSVDVVSTATGAAPFAPGSKGRRPDRQRRNSGRAEFHAY